MQLTKLEDFKTSLDTGVGYAVYRVHFSQHSTLLITY